MLCCAVLVCLTSCGLLRRNGARPREMADSRVLATARHIHICLRVAVLRDSSHFRGFRSAGGGEASRAWHPREFGAVLGGSASLTLPAPPLPSSSRRYAPQCFVAGIPASRLATCLTAHPTNRIAACRSVRHSPPRPLPHLPIGAVFFATSALADVPSARLTLPAYPPERSGVAEGELNAGCKSAATLPDAICPCPR